MAAKRYLFGAAILFHFALISLVLFEPKVSGREWYWRTLKFYGKWMGATATYGFFSPEIPREIVFDFEIQYGDGRVEVKTLQDTTNHEVRARVGNILRLFAKNFKKKEILRSLAASITASMFEAYPDAERIQIRGRLHQFPSMEEFRKGERAKYKQVYAATFRREMEAHRAASR